MASEARLRANAKYDAAHTRKVILKLNKETDADILERLDSVSNKQGYIKGLIRDDIEKPKKGHWEYTYPIKRTVSDLHFIGYHEATEPLPDLRFPSYKCSVCGAIDSAPLEYYYTYCSCCGSDNGRLVDVIDNERENIEKMYRAIKSKKSGG